MVIRYHNLETTATAAMDSERDYRSVLIINPNTTVAMTDALKPLVEHLGYRKTKFSYFTAPSGVPSINNEDDAAVSAEHCLPALKSKMADHDAFLVCCYSQHPLVSQLRSEMAKIGSTKPVTGIFEASVAVCMQIINSYDSFGIVSTGSQWEEILGEAVQDLLGSNGPQRYAGTLTTGLNADELHSTPKEEVDRRMKIATSMFHPFLQLISMSRQLMPISSHRKTARTRSQSHLPRLCGHGRYGEDCS